LPEPGAPRIMRCMDYPESVRGEKREVKGEKVK
jgi:hypothetical protein